jgi:hypothetical protein
MHPRWNLCAKQRQMGRSSRSRGAGGCLLQRLSWIVDVAVWSPEYPYWVGPTSRARSRTLKIAAFQANSGTENLYRQALAAGSMESLAGDPERKMQ